MTACVLCSGSETGAFGARGIRASKRTFRHGGRVTSISLEPQFWRVLAEMAEARGMAVGAVLAELRHAGRELDIGNFSSLVRVACVRWLEHRLKGAKS